MPGPRGNSQSVMRQATCKDCLREERAAQLGLAIEALPDDFDKEFVYNERAAELKLERGQTRSDRCRRHRARHRVNVQGMAVPYIDLQTIGEAIGAHGETGPTGPFGGLGPMPAAHKIAENTRYDLSDANVGMTDQDVIDMLAKLKQKRVLVAKAGTGTGKSTFMPYRLLDPPEGSPFDLAALGPIVVTEPRVQATTGVAWYVGTILSGAGGVGPGYPVGFQVKGNKAHDDSCQLIYVTDGTMINWLREERLSTIGTVIVDEAHERSTNIDLILGYLKKAIDRYPHLRVIITSATFDEHFYQEYFGGPENVEIHLVPAVKTVGYGFPLFSDLDSASPTGTDISAQWENAIGTELPLRQVNDPADEHFVVSHFQPWAPALKEAEVAADYPDVATGIGWRENLHDTTRRLLPLRFQPGRYGVPEGSPEQWRKEWGKIAPKVLGDYIVDLVKGLDEAGIYGDVLGFLPTTKNIEEAVAIIKAGLGIEGEHGLPGISTTVYPLISSLPTEIKESALAAQVKGDPRKIVVSTNLAETSLTVEGVRFVVDAGLIAQDQWDPQTAQGGVQTSLHSQAGVRQRWGRVGRKSPGWAFPLYTKEQFLCLAPDTAPGSTRSNLENLIMTAKLGGIGDVVNFDWPAKFWPDTWPQTPDLEPEDDGIKGTPYEPAARSRQTFLDELRRADVALRSSGAVDEAGDPTTFGKDMSRAPTLGSEASKIALMHADRLACVPEVATILKLLDNTNLVRHNGLLLNSPEWPGEWQLEAAERHTALASGCGDDAELVLQIMAIWERSDPEGTPAWEPSAAREEWSRRAWVNHEMLLKAAEDRHEVLVALSPAMKEDVKRFVEPALVTRARAAITRAYVSLEYRSDAEGQYVPVAQDGTSTLTGLIDSWSLLPEVSSRIIPLKRNKQEGGRGTYLSNIITLEEWAVPPSGFEDDAHTSPVGSLDLLVKAATFARPESRRNILAQLQALWPGGMRVRLNLAGLDGRPAILGDPSGSVPPAKMPETVADDAVEDAAVTETLELPVEVAEADAEPALDTSWPSPVEPEPDEEELEIELKLAFLADEADYLGACRECAACLAGQLDQCESPLSPGSPDQVTNDLERWLDLAWRNPEVSRPRFELVDGTAEVDGWYEVIGHQVDDDGPLITVRPAWRQDAEEDRPGRHNGVVPGDQLELEIGPERTGHRGSQYRTLYRNADGRRVGRFVLRVGSESVPLQEGGPIRGHAAQRSTGQAITLTFVPDDRQLGLRVDLPGLSLSEAVAKYELESTVEMVVTGVHETGGSAWLETTTDGTAGRVVKADVGSSGVGDLRASLKEGQSVLATIREVTEHNGKVQLQIALPDISGPTLEEIQVKYPSGSHVTMRVTSVAQAGARAWLVTPDGIGATALRKDAGARGVADLRDSLVQGDEVDTRVLTVSEYNGKIQISVALPSVSGPTQAEVVEQQFKVGSSYEFTVTGVTTDGRRAFLVSSGGVAATVTAEHVGVNGALSLRDLLPVEKAVEAKVRAIGEHNGEARLELELRHFVVPVLQQQLEMLRIRPGEVHDGVVTNVAEFGLFVSLGAASGLVHKSKLPGGSTSGYLKGAQLRVVVVDAGEDPRKQGTPKIGLAPA